MKQSNIIQIRNLTEDDNARLLELQKQFLCKTNSQAALQAVRCFRRLYLEILSLQSDFDKQSAELKQYKEIVSNVRSCVFEF